MSTIPTLANLIAESGAAAPAFFDKHSEVGDELTGEVLEVKVRQTIDPATRTAEVWPDGSPRLQLVISLKTKLKDDADDDGIRSVYVKWWTHQRAAFLAACEAAGVSDLEPGDRLTVTLSGIEKSKQRGMSDTKLFSYSIVRPF